MGHQNQSMDDILPGREVIFECTPVPLAGAMRVKAMDVETLVEITIQAPIKSQNHIMQRNALKRLAYVLRKKGLIA